MQIRSPIRLSRPSSHHRTSSDDSESSTMTSVSSFFKSRSFRFQKSRKMFMEKKSVSFAPLVSVIHVQSYKEDLKQELWYSSEDIHMIKKRNYILVNQYRRGYFSENTVDTFFGLEQYWTLDEVRCRRDRLYDAVLTLQDRCKDRSHSSTPDLIAKVYQNVLRQQCALECQNRIIRKPNLAPLTTQ